MEMLFYSVLSTIALFLYFPFLLMKKGPEDRVRFLSERLGLSSCKKTDIWIHAVSVGEILASLPFLKKLKETFPDHRIVLSTTTYTGQRIARERFPEADRIMYMPIDSIICLRKIVRLLNPEIFIAVETELWPMLLHLLRKNNSRIITLNGRISNDSFKGYSKVRFFMKKILSNIDFLYMQGKQDAERIIALGAPEDKVAVMGNLKFDMNFDKTAAPEWTEGIKGTVLLAASTHNGEEETILNAYKAIKDRTVNCQPSTVNLKLILVPRHPERFKDAEDLIRKKGLAFIRRSKIEEKTDTEKIDVILLDTMGELSKIFSIAHIAFIGGSLIPHGGHNIMEPAYWSKPIIFGPHMSNFPVAGEFLERSAAIEVNNAREISEAVIELLSDPGKASQMGRKAKAILDDNKGAVNKAIELIRGYIGTA